jgi:hypothetical protein
LIHVVLGGCVLMVLWVLVLIGAERFRAVAVLRDWSDDGDYRRIRRAADAQAPHRNSLSRITISVKSRFVHERNETIRAASTRQGFRVTRNVFGSGTGRVLNHLQDQQTPPTISASGVFNHHERGAAPLKYRDRIFVEACAASASPGARMQSR